MHYLDGAFFLLGDLLYNIRYGGGIWHWEGMDLVHYSRIRTFIQM